MFFSRAYYLFRLKFREELIRRVAKIFETLISHEYVVIDQRDLKFKLDIGYKKYLKISVEIEDPEVPFTLNLFIFLQNI